jgi:hypothetical protein
MNRIISFFATIALVATTVVVGPAQAASVSITLTDGNASANTTYAVLADGDFGVEFTSGGVFASGDTITLSLYDSAGSLYAQAFQAFSVAADTDADTVNGATTSVDGAFALGVAGKATYTFTNGGGSAIKLEAKFPSTFATGVYTLQVVSSDGDFGLIPLYVGSANQVSVTANVEPTLTFSLGGNSIALGTLTAGTPSTATSTMTVATNAASGLTVNVRNGANGLYNGSTSIANVSADTTKTAIEAGKATTEYYGIRALDTGSLAPATFVDGASLATYGSAAGSVEFEPMASGSDLAVVSSSGPTASAIVDYEVLANANSTSAAGNYTDTLVFTVVPSF